MNLQNNFTKMEEYLDMQNQQIHTHIEIKASPERIWEILTSFEQYPDWNPFIQKISGELEMGGRLEVYMKNQDRLQKFTPLIQKLEDNKQLEWLGQIPLGLFKGRHFFELEKVDAGTTRFIQGEKFSGLLSKFILQKEGSPEKRGKNGIIRRKGWCLLAPLPMNTSN
jgi:hypothetical protein